MYIYNFCALSHRVILPYLWISLFPLPLLLMVYTAHYSPMWPTAYRRIIWSWKSWCTSTSLTTPKPSLIRPSWSSTASSRTVLIPIHLFVRSPCAPWAAFVSERLPSTYVSPCANVSRMRTLMCGRPPPSAQPSFMTSTLLSWRIRYINVFGGEGRSYDFISLILHLLYCLIHLHIKPQPPLSLFFLSLSRSWYHSYSRVSPPWYHPFLSGFRGGSAGPSFRCKSHGCRQCRGRSLWNQRV